MGPAVSDDQLMLPLFDVPFDRLDVGDLRRFLGEAGDEGLTWEAKADHESGRLRPQQVHKAACGLANQIGGYLILGARRDAKGEPWQLPGINPRDDEIDVWIGEVLRRLRPEPRHQTRAWEVDDDRLVAVVWIDPVDRPPCIAPDGRVFQRVSGATVPVEDPVELARLQQRGQAALDRALGPR
jgi:predicted HTH transcriptional regulator